MNPKLICLGILLISAGIILPVCFEGYCVSHTTDSINATTISTTTSITTTSQPHITYSSISYQAIIIAIGLPLLFIIIGIIVLWKRYHKVKPTVELTKC